MLGEIAARILTPAPYRIAEYLTVDGQEIPACEQANLFLRTAEQTLYLSKPHGTLPAGLHVRMRYDRPRAEGFDADGCVTLTINSLGFRDEEFPVQKPRGEFRILALGDSFTYGWGVANGDDWPQQLERLLAHTRGSCEVVNAGFATGAATPDGYDRWLASDGMQLQPDLVVVGLCLNDMGEVPMLAYPVVGREPVLGGWSRLLDLSWQSFRQHQVRRERRDHGEIVRRNPTYWNATTAALRRLRDQLAGAHVPLLLVVFPMLSQLREHYPYASLHAMARTFADAEGIACLDLMQAFVGRDEDTLTVHPTDQHPNAAAHREFAAHIHTELAARGWLLLGQDQRDSSAAGHTGRNPK